MISTATIGVVLAGAFLLGVKFTVDLIKHRPRRVEVGFGDVRSRGRVKEQSRSQELHVVGLDRATR